jgi:hypothetical protein
MKAGQSGLAVKASKKSIKVEILSSAVAAQFRRDVYICMICMPAGSNASLIEN